MAKTRLWIKRRSNRHLLAHLNAFLLEKNGIQSANIYLSLACTHCQAEWFHSYRRDRKKLGEQASFIMRR